MKLYRFAFFLLLLHHSAASSLAQFVVDSTLAPREVVKKVLIGEGVVAGNIRFAGKANALAVFTDSTNTFGLEKGILLSSGHSRYISGPNDANDKSFINGTAGDADLENYTDGVTYDAAVLEFDFITASENLTFNFVFASEEYIEYVDSRYNDVFAFIVDGPGVASENIARIPGAGIPITINNVNHKTNTEYFRDNRFRNIADRRIWDVREKKFIKNKDYGKEQLLPPYNTQFDGFTTVLQAWRRVVPNEVYHIKIAVSDVSDGILDSGVIIQAGSFSSHGEQKEPIDPFYFGVDEDWLAQFPIEEDTADASDTIQGDSLAPESLTVHFDFDSCDLDKKYVEDIGEFVRKIGSGSGVSLIVNGHTDSVGTDGYNISLSRCRAKTVKRLLVGAGFPETMIHVLFFGEDRPAETNATPDGRAVNRRVEIVVATGDPEKLYGKQ